MTVPLWVLVGLRSFLHGAIWLTGIVTAIALSLSFAGSRERRIARCLWPLAGTSLWLSACLFMLAVASNWPGPPTELPFGRVAVPAALSLLGLLLGWYWMRWALTDPGARGPKPGAAV